MTLYENLFSVFADTADGTTHRYCVPCLKPSAERVAAELRESGRTNVRIVSDRESYHAPELLAVCEEIANSKCDLGDSERRIRLYSAITNAGGTL